MIITIVPKLVPTGVAARELGVAGATLVRWWQAGLVKPAFVTAGGHARWELDELREQLRARRLTDNDEQPPT